MASRRRRRRREERVDIDAVTQTPRGARLAVPSKRNPKTKVLCARPYIINRRGLLTPRSRLTQHFLIIFMFRAVYLPWSRAEEDSLLQLIDVFIHATRHKGNYSVTQFVYLPPDIEFQI